MINRMKASEMTEGPTAFENFQNAMKTILKAKKEPKKEKQGPAKASPASSRASGA